MGKFDISFLTRDWNIDKLIKITEFSKEIEEVTKKIYKKKEEIFPTLTEFLNTLKFFEKNPCCGIVDFEVINRMQWLRRGSFLSVTYWEDNQHINDDIYHLTREETERFLLSLTAKKYNL